MEIKTRNGLAEGLPLSDIQENNVLLQYNTEAILDRNRIEKARIVVLGIVGTGLLIYILWLTYYVMRWDVVNNVVRACGG